MPFFCIFRQPANFQKQTKQKFGVKFETYFQASLESGVFSTSSSSWFSLFSLFNNKETGTQKGLQNRI
jgi:hypothetical protein